ncbi:hypothetical protein TIFTF001_023004 [Ficus carica]|uniref:HTH myb-type domain-containing protein n=1 Tax=Ficus carica TaxID=3494 RepID=A0AA88ADS1_FICCA|nr:hypothetical protein TIFTF001_023004 [Ficus carica]
MLAVSPLRDTTRDEKQGEVESSTFSINGCGGDGFPDFADSNLLDSIDFDDLFIGINDGDVLPDLEMDPEILAEFSASGSEEFSEVNTSVSVEKPTDDHDIAKKEDKVSGSGSWSNSSPSSRGEESSTVTVQNPKSTTTTTAAKEGEKGGNKKTSASSTAQSKNSQGKRKVKVDWTPELHRRFVQAVEQLGVDKAVPSRILEIMGIDCLTRHNIASHLQKYRSHRKHLLAREAEAASWSQRRQMYRGAAAAGAGKRDHVSPWPAVAPTMGFPPMTPPPVPPVPPMHHHHHFRPLHVWGHPTVDQSLMHVWPPKHLPHSQTPPPPPPPQAAWPPPPDPSYWHSPHQRVPNVLTPGTPCFPQPLATAPSKESLDAAIGDVLAKPWLPLPLGLKPPSIDGVMVELQRQGVPKVPPSCA